jgi:signal transduction histidine kinase
VLATVYFAVAKLGFLAAVAHGVVSSAWPPSGVALAALLLWGPRYWPAITIGAFLVNASSGVPMAGAAGMGLGNTLEAVVGVVLLRRVARFQPSLERLRDVLALALVAAVATTPSATIGVVSLWLSSAIPSTSLGPLWFVWWSGDAMGVLVVAPVLLTWMTAPRVRETVARTLEGLTLLLVLVVLTSLLFQTRFSYVYAIFPFVSWAALRFGPRGGATATLVVSSLAMWSTLSGLGPFVASTPTHNLALLQTFMGLLALTALVLAALATERKRAVDALTESEAHSRQAQKMEAVGQLAGGVAHDFNNLLTVILGSADLLLDALGRDHPEREEAEQIRNAGLRAAELTRQLLAFSRQQVLAPQVIDLSEVVATMDKMLRRVLGEDIDLRTVPSPGLRAVRADPGQLEQVVMNLTVNARDAMPTGGKLTIETANVELDEAYAREHAVVLKPGRYVMLAVSDTGIGMDGATQAHIFEPFFTTKESGKGTGLGLATVYGIVKQSDGWIWVYSEPGHGTTFKVYLPQVTEAAAPAVPSPVPPVSVRGAETLLLVEDEEPVRHLVEKMLKANGYTVLVAANGDDAERVAGEHEGRIHLLMADVVLPGINGRQVAQLLTATRPGIRVLYLSGYTDEAIVRHGVLEPGVAFLQKPFSPAVLGRKVREVLDSPAQ